MADVFISYSNSDRAKAQPIANRLKAAGISVWWDGDLAARDSFEEEIKRQAGSAKVQLVLWSHHSVKSAWVLTEADIARRTNKLVPAKLDAVPLPLGFTAYQTADLSDWNGQVSHLGWQALLRALRRQIGDLRGQDVEHDDPGLKREPEPTRAFTVPKNAKDVIVFIAHAAIDKPRLRGAIEVLVQVGFQLWIDKPQRIGLGPEIERRIGGSRIRYGEDWKEGIRKAITKADVVLSFWSAQALAQKREQFHYELYQGLIQQKLKQCRLDGTSYEDIGTPYIFEQLADLSDFQGTQYHPELNILIEDMASQKRKRRGLSR